MKRKRSIGLSVVMAMILVTVSMAPAYATEITSKEKAQWEFYAEDLVLREVIKGYADGELHLDEPITRAETIAMVQRNFEKCIDNSENKTVTDYIDVTKDSWYYPAVIWGTEVGLIKGVNVEIGIFEPDNNITKEQLAVIIYNYFDKYSYPGLIDDMGTKQLQVCTDQEEASSWAKDAVEFCAKANILSLDANGNFNPTSPAKRGEFAEMLVKANYINDDYLSHSMRE